MPSTLIDIGFKENSIEAAMQSLLSKEFYMNLGLQYAVSFGGTYMDKLAGIVADKLNFKLNKSTQISTSPSQNTGRLNIWRRQIDFNFYINNQDAQMSKSISNWQSIYIFFFK